jgi:hypothetical protein
MLPEAGDLMERRKAERLQQRLICELVIADRRHAGVVVDLSQAGLFVQTSACPPPGERVRVTLRPSDGADIELEASVARRYLVPRRPATVARGGIGLRIESASDDYLELIRAVMQGEEAPPPKAAANASRPVKQGEKAPPPKTDTNAPRPVMQREERPPPETATNASPEASEGTAYRVQARQTSGTRSRSFQVTAPSEEEAKLMASAKLDEGWEILTVDPVRA